MASIIDSIINCEHMHKLFPPLAHWNNKYNKEMVRGKQRIANLERMKKSEEGTN